MVQETLSQFYFVNTLGVAPSIRRYSPLCDGAYKRNSHCSDILL